MKRSGRKWIAMVLCMALCLSPVSGVTLAQSDTTQPSDEISITQPNALRDPMDKDVSPDPVLCTMAEDCTAETHEDGCPAGTSTDNADDNGPNNLLRTTQQDEDPATPLADDGVNTAEELKAALEAGGEVTLTGSFEISEKMDILITKPVTLNLNGYTVTKTYGEINHYFLAIRDGGSLTLEDTNGGKLAATHSSYGYGIEIGSNGTLIVNGGTIETTQEAICNDYGASGAALEINGGTVHCTGYDSAISLPSPADMDVTITEGTVSAASRNAIFASGHGSLAIDISGGTLTGGNWTVYVSDGTDLTISGDAKLETTGSNGAIWLDGSASYPSTLLIAGGTIQGDYIAVDAEGDSEVTMTGGSVTTNRAAAMEVSENATAKISGGTLTGADGKDALSGATEKITVTGGTFSSDVSQYVYPGLGITEDGGNFTVARKASVYVNGSGGNDSNSGEDAAHAVKTLAHAMNLVADDGVIYVCGQVTIDTPFSLDGVTLQREANYKGTLLQLTGSDAVLTVSNTTIDGQKVEGTTGYLVSVGNGATLNLASGAKLVDNHYTAVYVGSNSILNMSGGEIKGNTVAQSGGGAVSVHGGTLNLTGGTICENQATQYDGGGIYVNNGTLNLNGGEIKDNTAVGAGGGVCFLGAGELTLNGTNITGNTARCGGGIYIESMSGTATLTMKRGEISGNKLALLHDGDGWPYMADGAGICAYHGTNSTATVVDIQGGTIRDNTATATEGTETVTGAGTAISLNSVVEGRYPVLKLSGSPTISGDVCLWDGENAGPVIEVAEGFAPTAPVEVNANYRTAGTAAVSYPQSMSAADAEALFTTTEESMMLAASNTGNTLVWLDLVRVNFKAPDNRTTYRTAYVRPGARIDTQLVPTESEVAAINGYHLVGWNRYNVQELWDFAQDAMPDSNITLLAVYALDAPTIRVTASTTAPHGGASTTLSVEASHPHTGAVFTYQWLKDGVEIPGETGTTLTVAQSGNYSVVVSAKRDVTTGNAPYLAFHTSRAESAPVIITAEGHVYTPVVTAPTCLERGYTTYTCTGCGDSYVDDYTEPQGHHFAAEWTTDAEKHWLVCTVCGIRQNEAVHMLQWASDPQQHWLACTVCGVRQSEAAHTFVWITDKEATETQAGARHQQCTVCGYAKAAEEIPATAMPTTGQDGPSALWILLLAAGSALAGFVVFRARRRSYDR